MTVRSWLLTLTLILFAPISGALNAPKIIFHSRYSATLTLPTKSLKIFSLTRPNRLVVDYPDQHGALAKLRLFKKKFLGARPIAAIRIGRRRHSILRLVIQWANNWGAISVRKNGRFKLTLKRQTNRQKTPPQIRKLLLAPIKHHKKHTFVLVIDPGHGGKDPGATGRQGHKEKDIVLKIAKKLAYIANKSGHFRAILTRNGDYYLTLRQRLQRARSVSADLFISIHADAYKNKRAHGASVYALSQRGASSEAALWLAKKENASELVSGLSLGDKSPMLRSVLINLSQTAAVRDALALGHAILSSLETHLRLHHRRVEQAAFVVLKSPDIPSVLIETGFISNKFEEKRLASSYYQQKVANLIYKGVLRYTKSKRSKA